MPLRGLTRSKRRLELFRENPPWYVAMDGGEQGVAVLKRRPQWRTSPPSESEFWIHLSVQTASWDSILGLGYSHSSVQRINSCKMPVLHNYWITLRPIYVKTSRFASHSLLWVNISHVVEATRQKDSLTLAEKKCIASRGLWYLVNSFTRDTCRALKSGRSTINRRKKNVYIYIYRYRTHIAVFIASAFCCDNKRSCITFRGRGRKIFLPLSDKTQAAKKYERKEGFSQRESAG